MLVEIPDLEVILGVILAFFVGLIGFYGYYKIWPYIKTKSEFTNVQQAERLEYYERQLIDMKIRLDALEIQGIENKNTEYNQELKQLLEELKIRHGNRENQENDEPKVMVEKPKIDESAQNVEYNDITDRVLHLITTKSLTSRDIQIALGKSREHTSRLMKKLFEDGYVNRNTNSKPYTYSITKKGKEKIGILQSSSSIA